MKGWVSFLTFLLLSWPALSSWAAPLEVLVVRPPKDPVLVDHLRAELSFSDFIPVESEEMGTGMADLAHLLRTRHAVGAIVFSESRIEIAWLDKDSTLRTQAVLYDPRDTGQVVALRIEEALRIAWVDLPEWVHAQKSKPENAVAAKTDPPPAPSPETKQKKAPDNPPTGLRISSWILGTGARALLTGASPSTKAIYGHFALGPELNQRHRLLFVWDRSLHHSQLSTSEGVAHIQDSRFLLGVGSTVYKLGNGSVSPLIGLGAESVSVKTEPRSPLVVRQNESTWLPIVEAQIGISFGLRYFDVEPAFVLRQPFRDITTYSKNEIVWRTRAPMIGFGVSVSARIKNETR